MVYERFYFSWIGLHAKTGSSLLFQTIQNWWVKKTECRYSSNFRYLVLVYYVLTSILSALGLQSSYPDWIDEFVTMYMKLTWNIFPSIFFFVTQRSKMYMNLAVCFSPQFFLSSLLLNLVLVGFLFLYSFLFLFHTLLFF